MLPPITITFLSVVTQMVATYLAAMSLRVLTCHLEISPRLITIPQLLTTLHLAVIHHQLAVIHHQLAVIHLQLAITLPTETTHQQAPLRQSKAHRPPQETP